jgi:restriction system protein
MSERPRRTTSFIKHAVAGVCPVCGWWKFYKVADSWGDLELEEHDRVDFRFGVLKVLDLADISLPINQVRSYLVARYDARFSVHPHVFEEVVASVFRDQGYRVRITSYSGDDGIDVILDDAHNGTIGIQVKRYREKIKVSQIREFTGALVIGGHTRGIFVTTSDFQRSPDLGAPVRLGVRGALCWCGFPLGQHRPGHYPRSGRG